MAQNANGKNPGGEIVKDKILDKDFLMVVDEIKKHINRTRLEIFQNANMSLLGLYYDIGKIINEQSTWGNNFINNLAVQLKLSFPESRGFSVRNLKNMKKYYQICSKDQKVQTASAQIPWSHNMLIFDKIDSDEKRIWYINETSKNGWSYDVLAFQIKTDLYERQKSNHKLNNFKNTLTPMQNDLAQDIMKDPYILNLTGLKEKYMESELEDAMVEKIKDTLLELGNGFSFVGNQYKLSIGSKDYYADLLFYHTKPHCYVVVELKNTEFKPDYIGQVNFYLSAIDDMLKATDDNPSIGIILCREKDKISVEYALRTVGHPIGVSSYEIAKALPTESEINLHIKVPKLNKTPKGFI